MDSDLAEVVGLWDDDTARGESFARERDISFFNDAEALIEKADAVVICSENMKHADHISMAAEAGKDLLCEKPIAPTKEAASRISSVIGSTGVKAMTGFPCPFSPTFKRLQARVDAGEVGDILALNTTNRGKCPGGWFTDPSLSGGGAMIDHVVHVTDLLRRLLKAEPTEVYAQVGSNMYGGESDDTAKLTISFPGGIFAALDSSWSRPQSFKTWGDVTMRVIGSTGTIDADLFNSGLETYGKDGCTLLGVGADLDKLMVEEFLTAINEDRTPCVTIDDGLKASRVAIAGYESVKTGQPVKL